MKKMMKKIKSNKLISKLVATLTICMVLLSSLSVSAFAADDEVSAANEETESITDVWTSVMNWITSSLSTSQGVFFRTTDSTTLTPFVLTATDIPSVSIVTNLPTLFIGDTIFIRLSEGGSDTPFTVYPYEDFDSSEFGGLTFDYALAYTEDGEIYPTIFYNATFPSGGSSVFVSGWSSETYFASLTDGFFIPSGSSLTFLGTLAVIGVAIAIAFLLIGLISRFLRLRG